MPNYETKYTLFTAVVRLKANLQTNNILKYLTYDKPLQVESGDILRELPVDCI